jgi:uncharacterized membrane protein YuzA (DUF378 family)
MVRKTWYDTTALIFAAIGAINWGLYTFGANVVRVLPSSFITPVYWIIALSGVWILARAFR